MNSNLFHWPVFLALTASLSMGLVHSTHAQTCTVDWTNVHQQIDGFGGGVVFLDYGLDPVNTANMNTLYGTNSSSQLGLTLLRVRIDPNNNWSTALQDAQKAVARGAGVLATPWTPPASMKNNGSTIGGYLLQSQYTNYANYLNNFAAYMKANGAPLRAISVQNEPDFVPTGYEGCGWTATQLRVFLLLVGNLITNAPVMMPESASYNQSLSDQTLNLPVAATNVAIIGEHLYGVNTIVDYPNAHNRGKPTWMTEFLLNDQTIGSAVTTAKQIYDCLAVGNFSAYIWWKCLGNANGLLNAYGVPQKRGFVMAQWSRFVRPGYYRIDTTTNADSAFITAFNDTNSGDFAIVAVNTNTSTDISQTFNLNNFPGSVTSVTPWITSASLSMASQTPVTVSGSSFSYTIPAQSVVTFVGQVSPATPVPPTLSPVADQVINAGQTLLVTNTATDPNVPSDTLTLGLLNNPSGATLTSLNTTNALFTWRAPTSSAGTTNLVTVAVTNTTTLLSDTNSFKVIVNPLSSQPMVGSIATTNGQVTLVLSGPQGPDYTVLTTTNLILPPASWQVLMTTNSPVTPVTLTLPLTADPMRFYSIQIGP